MKHLLNWLKKKKKTPVFKDTKYVIKPAFELGGVQYYQFDDIFNLPYERGLKAITFYEESRMKCTLEYLILHTEAVDKVLTSTKVNIYDLKKFNDQLAERLKFIVDVDILYKLASVVFFDENENPSTYEYKYNADKIKFWKENKSAADFFLQMPIQELVPYLKDLEPISPEYTKVMDQINRQHLDILSSVSSKEGKTTH